MKALQKRKSSLLMTGLACGLIAALAQAPAQAQVSTTGNGPYYATPSWDQKLTTGRFVVLTNWNNDAVLDRETGLVWEKAPSTSLFDWINASYYCLNLNLGGRTGWRLPAIPELMSLVDRSQSFPSLPSGHPFTVDHYYWSATLAGAATNAWAVSFRNGGVEGNVKSRLDNGAWCVRGGPGVDSQ